MEAGHTAFELVLEMSVEAGFGHGAGAAFPAGAQDLADIIGGHAHAAHHADEAALFSGGLEWWDGRFTGATMLAFLLVGHGQLSVMQRQSLAAGVKHLMVVPKAK